LLPIPSRHDEVGLPCHRAALASLANELPEHRRCTCPTNALNLCRLYFHENIVTKIWMPKLDTSVGYIRVLWRKVRWWTASNRQPTIAVQRSAA
jgi:hypothetical protein